MAAKGSQSLSAQKKHDAAKLFAELKEEDKPKKQVVIADQILKLLPHDGDAVAAKAAALVGANRFADCVKFLEEEKESLRKANGLTLAYAYYRLGKLDKADELVQHCPRGEAGGVPWLPLQAQILYKNEDYAGAAKVMSELKDQLGDEGEDIVCNLTAALIGQRDYDSALKYLGVPDGDLTHDLLCNKACIYIQQEQWSTALQCLKAAEKDMREYYLEMEDNDKEALSDDLATVRVQTAYILAEQGQKAEAAQILTEVMKQKPSSQATLAVGSNNLCSLRQHDGTVFDAYKRLKPLSSAAIDSKLSNDQRLAIRFNMSVLMGQMGQREKARNLAESIAKEAPGSHLAAVAHAAILCQDNKLSKAEEVLKEFLAKHPDSRNATDVRLLLAQVYLRQESLKKAVTVLREVETLRHQLGLAATLVAAYEKQGDIDAGGEVLEEAAAHWAGLGEEDKVRTLTDAHARLLLKHRRWEAAAAKFRKLQSLGQRDEATAARLAMCLANYDVPAAQELCDGLAGSVKSEMTVDQAEALLALKVKELGSGAASPSRAAGEAAKKKRRRPGKPPKVKQSGEPNPERWWAKKDRADFRALTKRQVREAKKQRREDKVRRQRQEALAREEQREKLKEHYEALRAKEAAQ